jgi:hypothetical protein
MDQIVRQGAFLITIDDVRMKSNRVKLADRDQPVHTRHPLVSLHSLHQAYYCWTA